MPLCIRSIRSPSDCTTKLLVLGGRRKGRSERPMTVSYLGRYCLLRSGERGRAHVIMRLCKVRGCIWILPGILSSILALLTSTIIYLTYPPLLPFHTTPLLTCTLQHRSSGPCTCSHFHSWLLCRTTPIAFITTSIFHLHHGHLNHALSPR